MNKCSNISVLLIAGKVCLFSGAAAANCNNTDDTELRERAQQKISLLLRMVNDSPPVERVLASENEEAIHDLDSARRAATDAEALLRDGCVVEAAETASGGLQTAGSAFSKVKSEAIDGRQQYTRLHGRTLSFLDSLTSQPTERQGLGEDDLIGMRRQIARAETVSENGDYREAIDLLAPVADRLQRRLVEVLHETTVVYEKTFSDVQEEYAYYAEQYRGYELLLQQKQLQPPHSSREAFSRATNNAQLQKAQAMQFAQQDQWSDALAAMQQALQYYEKALRLTGIRY